MRDFIIQPPNGKISLVQKEKEKTFSHHLIVTFHSKYGVHEFLLLEWKLFSIIVIVFIPSFEHFFGISVMQPFFWSCFCYDISLIMKDYLSFIKFPTKL